MECMCGFELRNQVLKTDIKTTTKNCMLDPKAAIQQVINNNDHYFFDYLGYELSSEAGGQPFHKTHYIWHKTEENPNK